MKKLLLSIFLLISQCSYAANDIYVFSSANERQRFESLTKELRCVVCQNQSLAESNAPLANDLRNQVYEFVQRGRTDTEIVNYLVERYGDFVLYKPPFKLNTALLWYGPFFLLTLGLLIVLVFVSKQKRVRT